MQKRLAERHIELTKLYQYIVNILPTLELALNLNGEGTRNFILPPSFVLSDTALKAFKARLDSLICAYVAAWWYWGLERNWVLGDRTTDYIFVPAGLRVQTVYPDSAGVICPEN